MNDNHRQQEIEKSIYLLAEIIPDSVIICSLDGKIQFANDQAKQLTEYDGEKLLELHVHDLIEEQYREMHKKVFIDIVADDSVTQYKVPQFRSLVSRTGIVIPVTVTAAKYRKNGTYNYIAVIRDERPMLYDLTAMQQVMDKIPAMVAIYDSNGVFKFINESFRERFNINEGESLDLNMFPDEETKEKGIKHMYSDNKKWESFSLLDRNGNIFTSSWYNMKISYHYVAFGLNTSEISSNEKLLRDALAIVIKGKKWTNKLVT